MKNKVRWLIFCLLWLSGVAHAQLKTVSGVVKEADGTPLMGVAVVIKGTTQGIITDIDGKYSIQARAGSILEFKVIGYKNVSRIVPKTSDTNVSIGVVLQEEEICFYPAPPEEKMIALGIEKTSNIPYKIEAFTQKYINQGQSDNALSSLDGMVAGLNVQRTALGVGERRVTMRGMRSLFLDNNVLYVIDGVPYDQPSDLNPEDIKEVRVLMGASASALYGASAANGVVLIQTQKPQNRDIRVRLSSSLQFENAYDLPQMQNTYGNEAGQYTSWGRKLSTPSSFDAKDFFRTGYQAMTAVNLSGGSISNRTYASVGSLQTKGIVPNTAYNRYNIWVRNVNELLNEDIVLDLTGGYTHQFQRNQVGHGIASNPIAGLYLYPRGENFAQERYFERYDPDLGYAKQYWYAGSGTADTPADMGENIQNPYWVAYRNVRPESKDRYFLSSKLFFNISNRFSLTTRFSLDNSYYKREDRRYASTLPAYAGENSYYASEKESTQQQYADAILKYVSTIYGHLQFTTYAGAIYQATAHNREGYGGNLLSPNKFNITNITPSQLRALPNHLDYQQKNGAAFLLAEVWWKYIQLTASGRADFSLSHPYASSKAIISPSVGLSTSLLRMFDLDIKYLLNAKVWAFYTDVAAPLRYKGWNERIFLPEKLQAERTRSYEAGISTSWLNDQVGLNAAVYRTLTSNQLVPTAMPYGSPYTYQWTQAGEVENQGIELSAIYRNNSSLFRYRLALNATANRNKITQLGTEQVLNDYFRLREGDQIGDLYDTNGKRLGSTNPDWLFGLKGAMTYKNWDFDFWIKARLGGEVLSDTERYLDRYGVSQASATARDTENDLLGIPAPYYFQHKPTEKYVYEATNLRLQRLALTYHFNKISMIKGFSDFSLSLIADNVLMLYNKAPFDPELVSGTGTYEAGYDLFMLPSVRSYGLKVNFQF